MRGGEGAAAAGGRGEWQQELGASAQQSFSAERSCNAELIFLFAEFLQHSELPGLDLSKMLSSVSVRKERRQTVLRNDDWFIKILIGWII